MPYPGGPLHRSEARGSERKIIDGRDKLNEQPTLKDLYRLVAGRADGATVQVTPVQMEGLYWVLAGTREWKEPIAIPANYRLSNVSFEVVE